MVHNFLNKNKCLPQNKQQFTAWSYYFTRKRKKKHFENQLSKSFKMQCKVLHIYDIDIYNFYALIRDIFFFFNLPSSVLVYCEKMPRNQSREERFLDITTIFLHIQYCFACKIVNIAPTLRQINCKPCSFWRCFAKKNLFLVISFVRLNMIFLCFPIFSYILFIFFNYFFIFLVVSLSRIVG